MSLRLSATNRFPFGPRLFLVVLRGEVASRGPIHLVVTLSLSEQSRWSRGESQLCWQTRYSIANSASHRAANRQRATEKAASLAAFRLSET
jgi:hypothetical protein